MVRLLESIPSANAGDEPFGAVAYVRRARRLRATLADRPALLHESLRQAPMNRPAAVRPPGELFADRVVQSLEGGLLRYSARADLLRRAAGMGIDRFEANLIIAAVQHRMREHRQTAAHARPRQRRSILTTGILVVAAVQMAIIALAWWLYSL